MSESSTSPELSLKRKIARQISDLPPLEQDRVRVVHITNSSHAEEIVQSGLNYEPYGMAMSTGRAWGKAEEVEYGSNDPRFNRPGLKAVILDMSNDEWKRHNKLDIAPGIIPAYCVVGVVDIIVR